MQYYKISIQMSMLRSMDSQKLTSTETFSMCEKTIWKYIYTIVSTYRQQYCKLFLLSVVVILKGIFMRPPRTEPGELCISQPLHIQCTAVQTPICFPLTEEKGVGCVLPELLIYVFPAVVLFSSGVPMATGFVLVLNLPFWQTTGVLSGVKPWG